MIDLARITVKAGDGGNGSGAFFRLKGKRRGKANGGDGGRGGDVYIEATLDLNTLEPFRFIKEYRAENGTNGAPNRRKGAQGQDLTLKVPVGTQIRASSGNESSGISAFGRKLDLVRDSQRVLVVRGGEGGRGNTHLRDEYGRRPKVAESGKEGETALLTLELKLIADVGLVGLPNAGKSTLLSALTSANPAVADYPFTTLEPNLGVIFVKRKKKVIADIPGLIEGASKGKGLGHEFLRHIERTKLLVHLIDISEGDAFLNYAALRSELASYSNKLARKKEMIVLNKIDKVSAKMISDTQRVFSKNNKSTLAISAKSGKNLDLLTSELFKTL